MTWHRQSPVRLAEYAFRLLPAYLLIPGGAAAAIQLTTGSSGAPAAVVSAASAALLLTSAALWRRDLWTESGRLARRRGLLRSEEHELRRELLTAVELKQTPLGTMLGAVTVSAYSSGDLLTRERCRLVLGREDGLRLIRRLLPQEKERVRRFSTSMRRAAIMALTSGGLFSDLLLTVPIVSWFAKHAVPSLPAAVALFPVTGWLLHFVSALLSCGGFRTVRTGGMMTAVRGIVVRRTLRFPLSAVSAVETRRTPLSLLLGVSRTDALIAGYGRCVLLPASDRRETRVELASLFPHGEPGVCVRSDGSIYWCRQQLALAAAAALFTLRLAVHAGGMCGAVLCIGLPAAAVILRQALVYALAGRKASVRTFGDCVEICGVRGAGAVKLRVMRGCIAQVKLVQHPFQRACGRCSLYILPRGMRRGIWCRHLPYRRCLSLIGRLG